MVFDFLKFKNKNVNPVDFEIPKINKDIYNLKFTEKNIKYDVGQFLNESFNDFGGQYSKVPTSPINVVSPGGLGKTKEDEYLSKIAELEDKISKLENEKNGPSKNPAKLILQAKVDKRMAYSGINNLAMGYSHGDLLLSSEIDGYIQDKDRSRCIDNDDSYILKYCFVREDLVEIENVNCYGDNLVTQSFINMKFND